MAAFCGHCGAPTAPGAQPCPACGAPLGVPPAEAPAAGTPPWDPQVHGRYRPERQLRRGDRGEVWLAHDTVLRRPVAVQVVDLPDPATLQETTADLRAAASLQHPHATAVYDLIRTESPAGLPRLLIVRQFVDGSPLTQVLAQAGPLTAGAAARLLLGPAEALAAAHRAGVCHRAIDTDAVLVDRAGSAKLAGLGLGRHGGSTEDVRAFGAVLYAALGLPRPTPGAPPVPLPTAAAGPLAPLLHRLAAARDDELPDAAALTRALAAVAAREPAPAPAPAPQPAQAQTPAVAPTLGPHPNPVAPASSPHPAPALQPTPGAGAAYRSGGRRTRAAGAILAVLAVALGGWWLLGRRVGDTPPNVTATGTGTRGTARTTGPGGTVAGPASFAAPAKGAGTIEVASGPGKACAPVGVTGWGDYPLADCAMWQPSVGLTTGRPLSKTDHKGVACQDDLRQPNPMYATNQANTWWIWTQADDGTWDWFPETAVSQGATGLPIPGVARCQREP